MVRPGNICAIFFQFGPKHRNAKCWSLFQTSILKGGDCTTFLGYIIYEKAWFIIRVDLEFSRDPCVAVALNNRLSLFCVECPSPFSQL